MDFEAARKRADERLNQELLRVRNLPKRSKIKLANKYGLKHASHTNAGLLKELEINLNVISREQRRVANELNKRQQVFTEAQRKSLSKCLPPLQPQLNETNDSQDGRNDTTEEKKNRTSYAGLEKLPVWFQGRKESVNQMKREMLVEMTAKSKEKTRRIIAENSKKVSIGPPLPPIHDVELGDSWITRLNRQRVNHFGKSCFPSLLEGTRAVSKEEEKVRTYPRDSQQGYIRTMVHPKGTRTLRGTVYEKVLKMPDPAKIPHLNPRDPKFYHVVMKVTRNRRTSKLANSDSIITQTSTVFTKHWN